MTSGEVTCITREIVNTPVLEESQISESYKTTVVKHRSTKSRSKTQKSTHTIVSSEILPTSPLSPSANLKQTLINFPLSPKSSQLLTRNVLSTDKTEISTEPIDQKVVSDQDTDKSSTLATNTEVTVQVKIEDDTVTSVQTIKQSISIDSPKSLKQTFLTVQTEDETVFKKPPSRRRATTRKRSKQPTRHHSVDLSAVSEKIESQPRTKAVSVSPKKNTRLDNQTVGKENTQKIKYQTFLTSYGIRKTARQCAKEIEREREVNYLAALRNNVESGMKIIQTEEKGRGIIATRPFYDGEFVVEYAGDLISEKLAKQRETEYKKDPNIGSYMFFFSYGGQRYCVDATKETSRLGRLINHSRLHPNCVVKVIPIDGVPRLTLFARRPIAPGEELLYDYGDRDRESLISHPWLKM